MLKTRLAFPIAFWTLGLAPVLAAPTVDMARIVGRHDVVYLAPARHGWQGLPLGNGTLGAQVWQPGEIAFQLNTPLSGVYGGALCRVRLHSNPSMLGSLQQYGQRLSLYEALLATDVSTDAGRIRVDCFIPVGRDVLVIDCQDDRAGPAERWLELETWRPSAAQAADRDGLLVTDRLSLASRPDYRFAVLAAVDGGAATVGREKSVAGRLRIPSGRFTLWVVVGATRDAKADPVAEARQRLAALRQLGVKQVRAEHAAAWADFWQKSFIRLDSADGVADYLANLWYVHLYAMGAGSRGEVPPKFNGGLWTDNRDEREWGPHYWHWNTQETYWPIFAANHLELHKPYQDMYGKMLPVVKRWTRQTWELDGAQYQETIPFDGAMPVWEKERGVHPRAPIPARVAHTNLILSSSAEIVMQFWWAYLYSGDERFLRQRVYPLAKEVAAFYVDYLEKDAQGRYNVYPSNAHESFWKVKNPTTDLAALRYFFPIAIAAAKRLGVDPQLQAVWQDRLDHLAPYARDPLSGAILPYELKPGEKLDWRNAENPDLFPMGVFPLLVLGSPEYDLAVKTFYARRNVNTYGWTTDSIAAARLGLAEPAPRGARRQQMGLAELLPLHAEYYQDHPSGLQDYYTRNPAIHPYLEGSGTLATAIGEMLLQSWDGQIRVCPALPKAWNADFSLLAMGGFEVSGRARRGQVEWVSIRSQRGQPAALVNPFAASAVVACDNHEVLRSSDPVLRFPTQAGRTYVVARPGMRVADDRITAEPNRAPKHLSPTSRRWIGRPAPATCSQKLPAEPNAPPRPSVPARVDRPATPEIRPARLTALPRIDGELSDPCWKTAVSLGPLLRADPAEPAAEPTEVWLGHDARAIYLAVACWESRMDRLWVDCDATPQSHDVPLCTDDSIEILLEPPSGPTWRLAVNALGARLDGLASQPEADARSVNPPWKAAVKRYQSRWTIEAEIPFSSLSPDPPAPGETWRLNLVRHEQPHGETSAWASSDRFGRCVFSQGVPAGKQAIADPDLVAHWTFDEVKGLWVTDASGHRHHAMMTGPAKLVPGKRGKALELVGRQFLQAADAPDLRLTEALTISLWVYPTRTGSMRLVDKGPAGGAAAYLVDLHPANQIRVITRPRTLGTAEALPENQWTHVAVTFGERTLRVYLNGRMAAEAVRLGGPITATQLPLRVGADSQGSNNFSGRIDDLRIYRKALSAEAVAALAQTP